MAACFFDDCFFLLAAVPGFFDVAAVGAVVLLEATLGCATALRRP